jgi:AcrR family transcriptional regulator
MARNPLYDRTTALDKAVALFWEKGYHGSSMKQIEQALDMRPGSLYAAFGSKDGLYCEALERYAGAGAVELAQHMRHHDSIIGGLQHYLRNIARACATCEPAPSRACMIVKTLLETSHTHQGLSDQAREILAGIEKGLTEQLDEAARRGELQTDVDTARLARLLQSQIMGLRAIAERDLPTEQIEALGDDMAALLNAYRAA